MTDEQMTDPTDDQVTDDTLASLPADRLAAMLRDKRKAEATVRGRLRDAEGERDGLRGTVEAFQRDGLRTLARAGGVVESALPDLDGHLPLADMLGPDGLLDPRKVTVALEALRVSRPHFFPMAASSGPGRHGGAAQPVGGDWGDLLRG